MMQGVVTVRFIRLHILAHEAYIDLAFTRAPFGYLELETATSTHSTQEEEIMPARMIFAIVALATVMMIEPRSADAAPYWPWCSQYGRPSLAHSCAFSSWEQCMETVRGIGGYCYANPYPPPPAPSARSAKPHRHAERN